VFAQQQHFNRLFSFEHFTDPTQAIKALKTLVIQNMAQSLQYSFYAGSIYKK
jgi:hypothetical protein